MASTSNYGAASTYVKLASYTATGTIANYTFSNIPQGYTDLVLSTSVKQSVGEQSLAMWFNGDTGSNYSATYLYTNGSSASSGRDTNNTLIPIVRSDASNFWTGTVSLMNYSNGSMFKSLLSRGGSGSIAIAHTGTWRSTAPITSITISGLSSNNFLSGSSFTLYGIKAAVAPKASGGDIIVTDGTYWYHAFRNTGVFTTRQSLTADILVVAGGGGGGANGGASRGAGGGGAGGYRSSTGLTLSGSYTATVGAGGAGAPSEGTTLSGSGSNSVFSTITSTGGGYGGQWNGSAYATGSSGGSGGGAGGTTGQSGGAGNTPSTSPSQGNNGGSGNDSYFVGGGGGGAGATGGNGSGSTGGSGGAGSNAHASWLYAVSVGSGGYVAGGGGGSARSGNGGSGGSGGGGAGVGDSLSIPGNGTVSTGSGGGAAGTNDGSARYSKGGNGGSGLVIVRYAI